MIEKVGLNDIRIKNNPKSQHSKQNNAPQNPMSPKSVMDYMNNSAFGAFSFKGTNISSNSILQTPTPRSKADADFDTTIDYNYFQLPKIKLKNGEVIQAMPDKTQYACAKSLYDEDNTVCIAPTGTGKTAIANYAISKNMADNKKTYYTTPLKALSNDKYREFCKIYGEENVGLMTGDIKLKKDAPIVIMTTEIYRNMALGAYANENSERFKDVQTVVFDEAHYINEEDRGKIWEESMMLTPSGVQILPLSATIGNGTEFSDWIGSISEKQTNLVEASPKDRHVPLVYYNYAKNEATSFKELIKGEVDIPDIKKNLENDALSQRQIRSIDILYRAKHQKDVDYNTGVGEQKEILADLDKLTKNKRIPHNQFAGLIKEEYKLDAIEAQEVSQLLLDSDSRSINNASYEGFKEQYGFKEKNDYTGLVMSLKKNKKLPAIIFKFSRTGCNNATETLFKNNIDLTTEKEKDEIKKIIENYRKQGIYFGKNVNADALIKGMAPHHAGLLPSYKKLVEELFSKKLLKVVVATSTLSAGINMPAKTVVITDVNRPNGNEFDEYEDARRDSECNGNKEETDMTALSANEFHQMAGRAGRRGVDTIGNVVLYNLQSSQQEIAQRLILKTADPLESKYNPSYCFLTAYYQRYRDDKLLDYFQHNTLKVFQAGKNKEQTLADLKKEFENYRNVLTNDKFLEQNDKQYNVTLKGEMLTKAHGYNELTLVNMIYNKALKNASVEDIAGFAGSMAGAGDPEEENEIEFSEQILIDSEDGAEKSEFFEILHKARFLDDKLEQNENKNNIQKHSDSTNFFAGQIAYRFASTNMENAKNDSGSIANFKLLTKHPQKGMQNNSDMTMDKTEYGEQYKKYTKKQEDGDIYRILSQSVDVLKQIVNISEFALESGKFKEDEKYYQNLIEKSSAALKLIQQPPVYDALSVA